MLNTVGLEIYQPVPTHAQQTSLGRLGSNTGSGRHKEWGIRLSDQEWLLRPEGQMSLGEMLHLA
eukprot:10172495-Karenia_brevis.AAC.1